MRYQQIVPPEHLQPHIRYFWTLESDLFDLSEKKIGPLADGCPGIIIQGSTEGTYYDAERHAFPPLFLYGQTVKRQALYFRGRFETLGICFQPYGLKSLFGFDAQELTDGCLDLRGMKVFNKESLAELVLSTGLMTRRLALLTGYLSTHARSRGIDAAVQATVAEVTRTQGNLSLVSLQQALKLSERTLERRFLEHVGISPKLFARINRFQASLQQLRAHGSTKLSDIAYDHGYTDQSYFIRSFKEFTGVSPRQFKSQCNHLVEPGVPLAIV